MQLPFRCLETCIESAGKSSERGMQMGVKRTELGLQHVAPDVKTETWRRQEAWRRNRQQE